MTATLVAQAAWHGTDLVVACLLLTGIGDLDIGVPGTYIHTTLAGVTYA